MQGGRRTSGRGGRRLSDADFRRLADEAKAQRNLSDVLGRHTDLKKRGSAEQVGLCPFHQERTPSFEVNDAKGTYHCHGCGASGDHFSALVALDGLTWRQAYQALTNDSFPLVSEEDRARQRAEDEKARLQAIADVKLMWAEGVSPDGTPAETYLREKRGITIELPGTIRYARVPTSRDDQGNWKRPYPAVLCACTGPAGELVGLQRIFLMDDGRDKRWGKRSKFSLGRPKGAAFKLAPAAEEIIMCEGPEDGLSLAQGLPDQAVWVALGTAMMPEIGLPPIVRCIVIASQNDKAGRVAAGKASAALCERGLRVRTIFPDPAFKDWNDQLRGVRA